MVHSTAPNSYNNLPSYPPDNHHSSDDVRLILYIYTDTTGSKYDNFIVPYLRK